MSDENPAADPAAVDSGARPAALPADRSLWRTGAVDVPRRTTLAPGTTATPMSATQRARIWIFVIGGVLTAFGLIAALAGHHLFVVSGGSESPHAWMWTGIVSLILGFAILMVELFLFAHSGRDDAPGAS